MCLSSIRIAYRLRIYVVLCPFYSSNRFFSSVGSGSFLSRSLSLSHQPDVHAWNKICISCASIRFTFADLSDAYPFPSTPRQTYFCSVSPHLSPLRRRFNISRYDRSHTSADSKVIHSFKQCLHSYKLHEIHLTFTE